MRIDDGTKERQGKARRVIGGEATRVQAVKNDALKMADDNSHQIDIGV